MICNRIYSACKPNTLFRHPFPALSGDRERQRVRDRERERDKKQMTRTKNQKPKLQPIKCEWWITQIDADSERNKWIFYLVIDMLMTHDKTWFMCLSRSLPFVWKFLDAIRKLVGKHRWWLTNILFKYRYSYWPFYNFVQCNGYGNENGNEMINGINRMRPLKNTKTFPTKPYTTSIGGWKKKEEAFNSNTFNI